MQPRTNRPLADAPPLAMRAHPDRNARQTFRQNGFSLALECLPDDISEHFLPYQLTLRQRQQADLFSREQYFYGVRIYKFENVWRPFSVFSKPVKNRKSTSCCHHFRLEVEIKNRGSLWLQCGESCCELYLKAYHKIDVFFRCCYVTF